MTNPVPKVLELIPYGESAVTSQMYDDIRMLIAPEIRAFPTNAVIDLLLHSLFLAGLIELTIITWPSVLGEIIFIKRKLNGK